MLSTLLCKNCKQKSISRHGIRFCSISCAATFNNKRRNWNPNQKPQYLCKKCKKKIRAGSKHCAYCRPGGLVDWSQRTLDGLSHLTAFNKGRAIRDHSNNVYKRSNKPKVCVWCGYNKHYDVCHIKPINQFSGSTPLSVVNSLNNLVALCKNHHWEFDHGLITKKKLKIELLS